jgi:hypothetical protein
VLDIAMAEICLERSRVVTSICKRVPARMTQHVRVCFKCQLGYPSSTLNHSGEASRSKGSTALGREHEGRLRILLTMQPPESTQLVTDDRMRAGRALLDPADVHVGRSEPSEAAPATD